MTEFRIDELARAAATTARNVRLYQERGLLPGPVRREGRANIYDDAHLARLRIINGLLERGFTISHIADFITSWETGKDLTEILGLQHAVTAAWGTHTDSVAMPVDTVRALLATLQSAPDDDKHLDRLADLRLIHRDQDADTVTLLRPDLLQVLLTLHDYGMDLPTMIELYAEMACRLEEVSRSLVVTAKNHIVAERGAGWMPDTDAETAATTQMLNDWRRLGTEVIHGALEQALDTVLHQELGDYLDVAVRQRSRTEK